MKSLQNVFAAIIVCTALVCVFMLNKSDPPVRAQSCGAGGPTQLGTVVELAGNCPQGAGALPNSTCRLLEVRCTGLNPVTVQVRIIEPAAGITRRGTVVFSSGASGTGFYEGNSASLFQELIAKGYRVIDRAWAGPNGWTSNEGGLRKESCRYATLLTWIRNNIHSGGVFVASGNSGGSAEVGYALTTWGRGDILDLAVPTSGPAVARLDYACPNPIPAEWVSLCSSIV
ncbi:MAG: hypothetical protein ACREEM_35385, partial [Blastocatellia bacterium]